MKWVRIDDTLPKEGARVLAALHVGTVKPVIAVGTLDKGKCISMKLHAL